MMQEMQEKKSLTKEQKTGFVLLLVFAILVVGLGFLQMRNHIYGPFVLNISKGDDSSNSLLLDEQMRMQAIDTDHDGLSDYEEINFYETSPYIPDSDSDGIEDKVEIEKGTNPLCPEGEECGGGEIIPVDADTKIIETIGGEAVGVEDVFGFAAGANPNNDSGDLTEFNAILGSLQDPNKVRELLLKTGSISEEELSSIDDNTLMTMVDEIVASQLATTTLEQ